MFKSYLPHLGLDIHKVEICVWACYLEFFWHCYSMINLMLKHTSKIEEISQISEDKWEESLFCCFKQ